MKVPSATYRVQLNGTFPFEDLRKIVDYLHAFGISTIYAAPIFQAREESTHGYDVVDPLSINREIGTLKEFRSLIDLLKQKKMNWLQDIVPNHMAFDPANRWLKDIMEHGPNSDYYHFFDINWKESGQVMAPFLGAPLDEILQKQELKVEFEKEGFFISYYDNRYPASARSYHEILSTAQIGNWKQKFNDFSGNANDWEDLKTGFYKEVQEDEQLKRNISSVLSEINNSEEKWKTLLELQFFRPTYWKQTEEEINYRRFFTINDLICVGMEQVEVFENYHHFIKELMEAGLINGLRIDHIDGLFDPAGYLQKLRESLGNDFYLVVEKILEAAENLPKQWPVQGSSGYQFLAQVNQLFVQPENEAIFTEEYQKIAGDLSNYEELVYEKKHFILKERMGGELNNLFNLLENIITGNKTVTGNILSNALSHFLTAFPVYRIYPNAFPLNAEEKNIIETAFQKALAHKPDLQKELEVIKAVFLGEKDADEEKMLYFLQRCQQFTGPLAAKGVEDTSFYIYNRLISQNEVGDSPENFGISTEDFHQKMLRQQRDFPQSLNASATHDTKRGEDARMRLNVLSEIPGEWFKLFRKWSEINSGVKKDTIPDQNEEYFIYQTLLGALPFGDELKDDFLPRTNDYLQKVLREAKIHSNWSEPHKNYESAVFDFIAGILQNDKFRASFDPFRKKVAHYGVLKSLSQAVLKTTAPGLPDIYQGTELWDFSYVDPDNRRPVDYDLRKKYLVDFKSFEDQDLKNQLEVLKENYQDGKIKMYSLFQLLNFRRNHSSLFETGEYIPVHVEGENSDDFISFIRRENDLWFLVLVPVQVTELFDEEKLLPKKNKLQEISLSLPEEAPKNWKNILTGEKVSAEKFSLENLFESFPVVILTN